MSAEGKKKRGVSGATNAKNIPFRYHGYPRGYTVSTALGGSDHPCMGGSRYLAAMVLGAKLPNYFRSDRMMRAAYNAAERIENRGRKALPESFAQAAE